MRLTLTDPGRADHLQPRHAVGRAPAVELVQGRELVFRGRHDELAAGIGLHAVAFAELVHQPRARGAEPGLERPGSVVDTRVDHPRVVAGLMFADRGLLVDDRQRGPGPPHEDLTRRGDADDPAAHDHHVEFGHHRPLKSWSTTAARREGRMGLPGPQGSGSRSTTIAAAWSLRRQSPDSATSLVWLPCGLVTVRWG